MASPADTAKPPPPAPALAAPTAVHGLTPANRLDDLRAYSPNPASHLSIPGTPDRATPTNGATPHSRHVIQNKPGYEDYVFPGKKAQAAQVEDVVKSRGFVPAELVHNEVTWFYTNLGIDDQYFKLESVDTIATHILSLYGSKILAYASTDNSLSIKLEKETETDSVYIHTSQPGVSEPNGPQFERRIDEKFLDTSNAQKAYRVESYRSAGTVSSSLASQLRCYFVSLCSFAAAPADPTSRDIKDYSDKSFLSKVSPNTLEIYQQTMDNVLSRSGPVVDWYEVEGTSERRIVIGYKQGQTHGFFSAMSELYHFYGIYSTRKYVEQFSNGVTIMSLYLQPLRGPPIHASVQQIIREASLIWSLPDNPFFGAKNTAAHAVQEAAYAYTCWIFAQHFLNRLGSSYLALKNFLNEDDPAQGAVLADIKTRFREETYTPQSIQEVIDAHPELIRMLYVDFAMVHYPANSGGGNALMPTLSYQRLNQHQPLSAEDLRSEIKRRSNNKHELSVLESFLIFNRCVLKTNFYQPTKVALSFRLDPSFLLPVEYPKQPFGLIFVIGSEFRGFHVRFKDVARGGIRIIRSRNKEVWSANMRNLFDENYNLASTQALKNKDIPEGGAKGTILPDLNANPRTAFEKYVDSIIDLLIPGHSPGIKEPIVDLFKKEEILFLGPDEGTADMMDWACTHARTRGAPWWRAFTTGKSAEKLGGVPHDTFGMTSLSVRQYSIGIYKQLGLQESQITKVQTGGPDGDLGSNEILLSKDKTITIIDGSGVLHDPAGLDRPELVRLAKARKMISNFDASKLGPGGYRVLCEDTNVVLPSGEQIPDATEFRNTAHFRYKSDIFVPCGGRPAAVNISNVANLWDSEGKPNFKYIVEGANLFIAPQARLALEKKGVILYKDASANKGGVTSSSLEVLVGLSLDDASFGQLMTADANGHFSDFYLAYVRNIQQIISVNAAAEFNRIWKEALATNRPRTVISDEIGQTLINLQQELEDSNLDQDAEARRAVLRRALPKTLVEQVGLETILQRLPEAYQKSLFASYVASNYIYKYGIKATQVDFFHYFSQFKLGAAAKPAPAAAPAVPGAGVGA